MEHKISWLNFPSRIPETWNPTIGCSKISAGCDNCYAKRMANRLAANPKTPQYTNEVANWDGTIKTNFNVLTKPYSWTKPRAVFVNSMSDLFHENTSLGTLIAVFNIIKNNPKHLFIVLTKRPRQMQEYLHNIFEINCYGQYVMPKNLLIGVTAEEEDELWYRTFHMAFVPKKQRILSLEPLLQEIKLLAPLKSYSWVIVGGETGPKARPMMPSWVSPILVKCKKNNIPFHFKQWSAANPNYSLLEPEFKEFPKLLIDKK